jgi:formate hydrogenlyase subunit 6/NADH:ubiquinone oxidoreductase subunit I
MPIAILPDIDEQRCIGCALCVEICTTLGPDVLRVKPVEGWKRGKAFVFYPEDETNELHSWTTSTSSQKRYLHQRLGRRRSLIDCIF